MMVSSQNLDTDYQVFMVLSHCLARGIYHLMSQVLIVTRRMFDKMKNMYCKVVGIRRSDSSGYVGIDTCQVQCTIYYLVMYDPHCKKQNMRLSVEAL